MVSRKEIEGLMMKKPIERISLIDFSAILLIFSMVFTSCEVNSEIKKNNLVGVYSLNYNARPFWFNYAYVESTTETINLKEKYYEQTVVFKERKITNKGIWNLVKLSNSNIFKVELKNAISLEEKRMSDYDISKSNRLLFVDIRGINFLMQKQGYALCYGDNIDQQFCMIGE